MGSLEDAINVKLWKLGYESLISQKTNVKKWLLEIEEYIQRVAKATDEALDAYRESVVTVKGVSKMVDISRQSIYNHPVLLNYIEYCADTLRKKAESERDEIKTQFDNMVIGFIELQNIKIDAQNHEREVQRLVQEKEKLLEVISQEDKETAKLKKRLQATNVDNLIRLGNK